MNRGSRVLHKNTAFWGFHCSLRSLPFLKAYLSLRSWPFVLKAMGKGLLQLGISTAIPTGRYKRDLRHIYDSDTQRDTHCLNKFITRWVLFIYSVLGTSCAVKSPPSTSEASNHRSQPLYLLHPEVYGISNKMSVADMGWPCSGALVLTSTDLVSFLDSEPLRPPLCAPQEVAGVALHGQEKVKMGALRNW